MTNTTRKLSKAQRAQIYRLMALIERTKERIERIFDRAGVSTGQAKRSEHRVRIWREKGR